MTTDFFQTPRQTPFFFFFLYFAILHLSFKLDFIQLSLSMGYQYILIGVCMFYGWVEAIPCCNADASQWQRNC